MFFTAQQARENTDHNHNSFQKQIHNKVKIITDKIRKVSRKGESELLVTVREELFDQVFLDLEALGFFCIRTCEENEIKISW